MLKLIIVLLIVAASVACAMFGLPALSVVMACLACFMAGLVSAIIAMLIGTNVYKIDYETAFNRGFWGGTALVATIVVAGTGVLNLLAGGLTTDLVQHLWQVSLDCAVASFAVAIVTAAIWGVLVFGRRRK